VTEITGSGKKVLFEESQAFRHPGVWALVAIPICGAWFAAIWQLLLGRNFGDNPAPDWVLLAVVAVVGVLLPLWLATLRLVTRVDEDGVDVRFRPPLAGRRFPFEEIESCDEVRYLPIREFGGWGIRWGGRRVTGLRWDPSSRMNWMPRSSTVSTREPRPPGPPPLEPT
jgi:hypothetical protein